MTEKAIYILAVLLALLAVLWLLRRKFPGPSFRHWLVRSGIVLVLLMLPVSLSACHSSALVFLLAVACVAVVTLAALADNRVGATLFELYPAMIGLAGALLVVADFIMTEPSLHERMYNPVIGLFVGLGLAVLTSVAETALPVKKPFSLHAIGMCSVAGFFAGYPGVFWVVGLSVPLCIVIRLYNKRLDAAEHRLSYNGGIGYALLCYLCLHAVLGV